MIIKHLAMQNFMRADDTAVDLPESGVVLVTGLNGAGKSTIIEAVAHGLWRKTLRGTSPWRPGQEGLLQLTASTPAGEIAVLRKATKGGGTSTTYTLPGGSSAKGDTETKTQAAIEASIGPQDLWRRTHVFSSSDAAHFSTATDAERKSLIESILGLSVFDRAYESALAAAQQATRDLADAQARVQHLRTAVDRAKEAIRSHEAAPVPQLIGEPQPVMRPAALGLVAPEPPSADQTYEELVAEAQRDAAEVDQLRKLVAEKFSDADLQMQLVKATAVWTAKQNELTRVLAGQCGECGREYAAGDQLHARDAVEEAAAELREVEALVESAVAEFEERQQARRVALDALLLRTHVQARLISDWRTYSTLQRNYESAHAYWAQEEANRVQAHAAAMVAWQQRAKARQDEYDSQMRHRADTAARLVTDLHAVVDALFTATETVADLEVEQLVAKETVRVLGPRGVRAFVLGEALVGIEQVANAWLSRMAPGITVSLKAYSESKTGAVSDRISLQIAGAGGGFGYQASSGGERRRVDAAILLALAEVAAAARGTARGTLFLDEVFDAIDSDGAPLVAEAIGELGQTRPVVVITHNQDLARHVPATVKLLAEAGSIRRIP